MELFKKITVGGFIISSPLIFFISICSTISTIYIWSITYNVCIFCSFYLPTMILLTVAQFFNIFGFLSILILNLVFICKEEIEAIQDEKGESEMLIESQDSPKKSTFLKNLCSILSITPNVLIIFIVIFQLLMIVFAIILGVFILLTQPQLYTGIKYLTGVKSDIKILRDSKGFVHIKAKDKNVNFKKFHHLPLGFILWTRIRSCTRKIVSIGIIKSSIWRKIV
jgi:hypothetical protein